MSESGSEGGLIRTLAGDVLSSIPILTALVFVAVAIKVFRVSNMETVTTVSVISSANIVNLFEGVIVTLLPGFLAGIVAAAIWWWSKGVTAIFESPDVKSDARRALRSPRFTLVWILLVISFYTISWPVFVIFLIPVIAAAVLLIGQSWGRWTKVRWTRRLLNALRMLAAGTAIVSVLFVALTPTVWLPLRAIILKPGHSVEFHGKALPLRFAAYILSSNTATTSLLLDSPRGVIQVSSAQIQSNPALCILPVSPYRWLFVRASQVIHLDSDYGSPYQNCP